MYRSYWKILGVLLFIYVLIGGLGTPLKPGIYQLDAPTSAKPGEYVSIKVTGYNSTYAKAEKVEAWLKLDDGHYTSSLRNQVIDNERIIVNFLLPPASNKEDYVPLTLIMYNEIDGPTVLPDAISLSPVTAQSDTAAFTQWQNQINSTLTPKSEFYFLTEIFCTRPSGIPFSMWHSGLLWSLYLLRDCTTPLHI